MAEPILYSEAPDVEGIANRLIPDRHKHLLDVELAFLFTSKTVTSKGKAQIAKVKKLTPLERYLAAGDSQSGDQVALVFSKPLWEGVPAGKQEAVVDFYLSFVGFDDEKEVPVLKSTDVADFTANVAKYGPWRVELEEFLRAAAPQLRLFEPEKPERKARTVKLTEEEFNAQGQTREPVASGV